MPPRRQAGLRRAKRRRGAARAPSSALVAARRRRPRSPVADRVRLRFDGAGVATPRPRRRSATASAGPPSPADHRAGRALLTSDADPGEPRHRDRLPRRATRRAPADAARVAGEPGPDARSHAARRRRRAALRWYRIAGGEGPATGAGRRRTDGHGRLLARERHRHRRVPVRHRPARRTARRSTSSRGRAVDRRLAHAPARRPGAHRRHDLSRVLVEGRHRRSTSRASSARRSRTTRSDAGNHVAIEVAPRRRCTQ